MGQLVAVVTGTEGTVGGVLAVMRASSVVLLTTVYNLHFNACRGKTWFFLLVGLMYLLAGHFSRSMTIMEEKKNALRSANV